MTSVSELGSATTSTTGAANRAASWSEHLAFSFFGLWLMGGLGLDGWAHRHRPELESFLTPWHAVFYSGFIALAAWLGFMTYRRLPAPSLTDAIPIGYELAVVGLGLFAVGGVGDSIWHTAFGIETSIDALLSPTHLLMLGGGALMTTAPVRAHWRQPSSACTASLRAFLPVALAMTLVTTVTAFFLMYANGLANWPMTRSYIPQQDEVVHALGVLSTLVFTVILLAPMILLLQRWRTPPGTFTLILALIGVFMAGLDAFEFWWQVIGAVAGGITADVIIARAGDDRRRTARAVSVAVPLVMWSVSTVVIHVAWQVKWPPELWLGQIVLAALAGLALSLLAMPPLVPGRLEEP